MTAMPTGYTIIEAADMAAATELAKDCPLVMAGRDITVLETLRMRARTQPAGRAGFD